MRISYTIYKHSVLATIVGLIGSVLVAIGVVQAVDLVFDGKFGLDLIGAIILAATGGLFHFLASLINDKVVAKKTRKALENPEICKILQSPIGAYEYSKKNSFPEVYALIELINPSVAQVLLDAMEHNKKEKEILAELEALENEINIDNNDSSAESVDIVEAYNYYIQIREQELENSESQKRSSAKFIIIYVIILGIAVGVWSYLNHNKPCDHYYSYSTETDEYIEKKCIYCNDIIRENAEQPANAEEEQPAKEIKVAIEDTIEFTVTDSYKYVEEKEPLVMPDGMEIPQLPVEWFLYEADVKNVSKKDIKSFSGTLYIQCGEYELELESDFNESVASGETIHLKGYGYRYDSIMSSIYGNVGLVILNSDFSKLSFKFELYEFE